MSRQKARPRLRFVFCPSQSFFSSVLFILLASAARLEAWAGRDCRPGDLRRSPCSWNPPSLAALGGGVSPALAMRTGQQTCVVWTGGYQPEIAHPVLVVVRHMFGKGGNEHLFRPLKFHFTLCSRVLCQEPHFSIHDLHNVIQRDRWPPNVPASVAQELSLRHKRADIDDMLKNLSRTACASPS